ncbi:MAG TPA: LuxR C-terminal-related transcriptional regulator [Pseudonocardiaceae bacterium]|nr:LuxR C-terminal-related transcriptional regulator [Pseudonocardiaceae bacterium]
MTSYVGRRQEGAEVRRLLSAARLVTLTGPGGVGKTRLATRVARDIARAFPDGVAFVELAQSRDGALLPNLVADRLGLHDQSSRSVTDHVLDHLRDRATLLVLDNCEHLVGACAEFAGRVLAACPRVVLLATSRQSLDVQGEQVLPVPSLAVSDGVRLFADRAAATWPKFTVTPENGADLAELCERLDGLPLAIELAAARTRSLSPRQIIERLTDRLSLLTSGPRTVPGRQQTLRATIDWSYDLCSAAEQAFWATVSVFAGSFDLEAAEHVCAGAGVDQDAVLDLIDGLLDKSVLVREEHDHVVRYRMLETLREYGQERLAESGDRARVARLHRDWFDTLTALADEQWISASQLTWIRRLRRDQANLRAALDWSITEPGEAAVALRMASRVDEYWTLWGLNSEARMWLERALAATSAADTDPTDRTIALATCALFALWQTEIEAAEALLAQADELAAGIGDEVLNARITRVRSLAAMLRIDVRTAELAAAAVATFRAHGLVRNELHPLFIHGVAAAYMGDIEAGRRSLRRQIALSEAAGEFYYQAQALFGIAMVEVNFGEVDVAEAAAKAALKLDLQTDAPYGVAHHTETLAWVADAQGDHPRAATLFGAAATVWDVIGVSPDIAVPVPHRKHVKAARKSLGDDRFEKAFAAGRSMSQDEATRYALGDQAVELPSEAHAPPNADSHEPLTAREWEIARLVAAGLTNRDIAGKLIISLRTADTHVQHILTKLGFNNRAQIATWVAGQGPRATS